MKFENKERAKTNNKERQIEKEKWLGERLKGKKKRSEIRKEEET